ncbi:MAG: hydantoinase/carbamoylase family amidase [Clostridia bacterium]|nr:hydantoinase/carbamoylase family amidase [Clostridia bacterium]NCC45039.1 hydantoinase/carbamoylase family amidase [Clostridia bacterium]
MLKSNPDRMKKNIDTIASFTEEPGKITRRTYSKAWVDAVDYVTKEMEDMGMTVRMDSFGNVIGSYNPAGSKEKPIGIGSHIDSVVNAGAYDGVAGVVVGMELIHMLHENNIVPKVPLEILATADEEGAICQKGYFGRRYMAGDMTVEEYLSFKNIDGKNLEVLRKESGIFEDIPFGCDNGWAKGYYQRFYEVHVEQGGVLEANKKDVGIVQGVVGIGRLFIDFYGESDHAGPTVMEGRKDAMVAAADFIMKAWEVGQANSGQAVTTVARIQNTPNIHNVIAGKTSIVFDYRAIEDAKAEEIKNTMKEYALGLQEKYGIKVTVQNPLGELINFCTKQRIFKTCFAILFR